MRAGSLALCMLSLAAAATTAAAGRGVQSGGPAIAYSDGQQGQQEGQQAKRFDKVALSKRDVESAGLTMGEDGGIVLNLDGYNASMAAAEEEHPEGFHGPHLQKRQRGGMSGTFSGRASYYEPGLGACGRYNSAGDSIVAIGFPRYGDTGVISPWCFQTITISYGGRSAQAQIVDACQACGLSGLDLSPSLFRHFADLSVGIFYMSWTVGSGRAAQEEEAPAPITTRQRATPTTTSSTWSQWSTTQQWTFTPTTTSTPPPTTSSAAATSTAVTSTSTSSTAAAVPTGPTASDQLEGNLDRLSQVVIALGQLAAAAADQPVAAAVRL